jgi:hypothetical protein
MFPSMAKLMAEVLKNMAEESQLDFISYSEKLLHVPTNGQQFLKRKILLIEC